MDHFIYKHMNNEQCCKHGIRFIYLYCYCFIELWMDLSLCCNSVLFVTNSIVSWIEIVILCKWNWNDLHAVFPSDYWIFYVVVMTVLLSWFEVWLCHIHFILDLQVSGRLSDSVSYALTRSASFRWTVGLCVTGSFRWTVGLCVTCSY
jgi:hypothetical protein